MVWDVVHRHAHRCHGHLRHQSKPQLTSLTLVASCLSLLVAMLAKTTCPKPLQASVLQVVRPSLLRQGKPRAKPFLLLPDLLAATADAHSLDASLALDVLVTLGALGRLDALDAAYPLDAVALGALNRLDAQVHFWASGPCTWLSHCYSPH